MAESGERSPKGGKKSDSGGGVWGFVNKLLQNVSFETNVGARAARQNEGNPTDPAARMNPVKQDRQETYDEMIYRTTDGERGQAPAVRVDRERGHVARSLDTRMGASAPQSPIPEAGGQPLSKEVRSRMEPRLGADLSDVRVHTSGESGRAAEGLSAKAFAVGNEVHFGTGNYQPGTKEGDRLIAHELTHVVQGQRSGIQRKADEPGADSGGSQAEGDQSQSVSDPADPAEKEADAVGDHVAEDLHAGGGDGKEQGGGAGKAGGKPSKAGRHGGKNGGGDDKSAGGQKAGDPAGAEANAGHEPGDGAQQEQRGKEKAPQIGAKSVGVGRKVFRSPTPLPVPISAKLGGVGLKIHRAEDKDKEAKRAKAKALAEKEALRLLEEAATNEKGITETLTAAASANGGEMKGLEHRLKSLDSLARKIADRARVLDDKITVEKAVAESVAKINDALRYTVQLPADTYRKGAAAIHTAMTGKGFQITAQRNFWDFAVNEEFPYRGINMTLKHPKGQVFELQFHTPESLSMKSELHKLYEEWRAKTTPKPRRVAIEKIMLEKWRTVPVPK